MMLSILWRFLIVAAVFVPLERLFALHAGQKILREGWKTDLVYAFINSAIIQIGAALVITLLSECLMRVMPSEVPLAVASQPAWVQFIEVVIIADIGFYIGHRTAHAVPFLWRFHQVHHSSERLDWLAAARVHPVDQIFMSSASMVPILVLGFSNGALLAYLTVYFWHSYFLHSNVRVGFGFLRPVIASPEFHHWHHADESEAYDKNYAGQLSVLDRLFGTLYIPADKKPEKYGTGAHLDTNYLSQLIYPFKN